SLQQEGADLIDDAGTLTDQSFAHTVQRLQVELLGALGRDELHGRALDGFGDRLRITEVVLLSLRIGAHVLRRHQSGVVAKHLELATEMMRADAGLHPDQTRRQVGEPRFHLAARPLLPQHDGSALIVADDVERVLADIDADHSNRSTEFLRHGVLLVWAPLTSLSLVGQEHGRTIPLADLNRTVAAI